MNSIGIRSEVVVWFGQEPPKWVTDLVQFHLVEAVPKSKYDSHRQGVLANYELN
ncbi:uncharacterized protein EDB91DRAFT_1124011 [Suillus paluster]|uniref:uncharacterized protein n=1 Tax=Suillus paluster TaxID=48578 RepID=UPI001B8759E0|nr:uncharacterized protein EDB91DRAFT_1169276 [Suillus paluster]XP_041178640.1 uncharacterized protein EDB91DRAFT_1124011 [Suillus paluster]KAG1725171.1 hypothetical protein EDB91DRAFT_1169276 [Suillus paluster]KAG1743952.1 hypothetical protein EDB91DRAFT_1124011 [Suillus paluster]